MDICRSDDDTSNLTTTPTIIEEEDDEGGVEDILQVFRIFKLARVLKLARHSPGLQVQHRYLHATICNKAS